MDCFDRNKRGIPEEYKRSERGIFLDKKKLQVETAEPQEVLGRMAGTINLVFEEVGKVYEPMFLKGVQILLESQFELDVRDIYRNKRKMVQSIDKQIGFSGIYSIRFEQTRDSFC